VIGEFAQNADMRSILKSLLLITAVALVAAVWMQQRAQRDLRAVVTELRPHALLRYQRLLAWPPGEWRLEDVTVEPVGEWRERLAMPVGARIAIARLQLRPPASDQEQHWQLTADDVLWPVPAGMPGAEVLASAGHTLLRGSLHADAVWTPAQGTFTVDLQAAIANAGQLDAGLSIIAGAAFPAPVHTGTTLRGAHLHWQDHGLLGSLKSTLALREQLPVRRWEQQQMQALERRAAAGDWRWSADDRDALRSIIRDPARLRLQLAPPSPVRLDDLSLYTPGDYWALLGVQLDAGADQP